MCLFHMLLYFQNNPVGQSGLGLMYLHGKGVPKVSISILIIFSAEIAELSYIEVGFFGKSIPADNCIFKGCTYLRTCIFTRTF